MTFCKN